MCENYIYFMEKKNMPAKSKSQQRLFGMAYAARKGEIPKSDLPDDVEDVVNSKITTKDIKKFAKTKHKGLPERLRESLERG